MQTRAGALLREYRETHGLSQQELAAILGVTQSTISDLENGNINPRIKRARVIADLIGVTVGELLAEPEPEHA